MQISARVTNSFFCFLNQHHFDTSRFHELTHLETSLMRDPMAWLDIQAVEVFLKKLSIEYGNHFVDKDLTTAVGHNALQLKAWGNLDHVLKLSPPNFYRNIDEIFQWFVHPFSIKDFNLKDHQIYFECGLSSVKYPYIADYLRSILEALPTYYSKELSEVTWEDYKVVIDTTPFGQMSFALDQNTHSLSKKKEGICIDRILAREILDSRGQATLEIELIDKGGYKAQFGVPAGASKGRYEAFELRDQDQKRFFGKGVLKACENAKKIGEKLKGVRIQSIQQMDQILLEIDPSSNKTKIGANTLLGISVATAKLLAKVHHQPFYSFFHPDACALPIPLINVFNGGAHANNCLNVQEFMLVPHGFSSFKESIRASSEVFHTLKTELKKQGYSVAVGDEGGVAPSLKSNEEVLKLLLNCIEKTGYQPQSQISIALDVAASSFYKDGFYLWENQTLSAQDLMSIYNSWIQKYPILSIEDGLEEDQWDDWLIWTQQQGKKIQIVGDDLFVTNKKRLTQGIQKNIANSLLVKINQIGTVSEAFEAVQMAHQNGYTCVLSHRSGETEDTFIADLSLAFSCEQIKTGGMCRGERIAKYNRLLRIEEELGDKACYQTWSHQRRS